MHNSRAGEIEKTSCIQKTATPFPGGLQWINRAGQQRGKDQERPQLNPFRQSTRHNRRRGGAEHQLKEIIRSCRGIGIVVNPISRDANAFHHCHTPDARQYFFNAPSTQRIHQIITDQIVSDTRNAEQTHVFGQLHRHIFRAHQTCFQHCKTGRHKEHQKTPNQEQQCVHDPNHISWHRFGGLFGKSNRRQSNHRRGQRQHFL